MTDEYEIPTGDTGHEPGTFLMVLTALKPFKLYETRKGWTREQPEPSQLIEAYDKIEWVFADDQGEIGTGTTSTARSERSTLFAWATGLGLPAAVILDRSKPIPASQLIGREANVTFTPDANGYSRISAVVPPARAPRAAASVAQPGGEIREIIPPQPAAPNPSPSPAAVPAGAAQAGDDLPF